MVSQKTVLIAVCCYGATLFHVPSASAEDALEFVEVDRGHGSEEFFDSALDGGSDVDGNTPKTKSETATPEPETSEAGSAANGGFLAPKPKTYTSPYHLNGIEELGIPEVAAEVANVLEAEMSDGMDMEEMGHLQELVVNGIEALNASEETGKDDASTWSDSKPDTPVADDRSDGSTEPDSLSANEETPKDESSTKGNETTRNGSSLAMEETARTDSPVVSGEYTQPQSRLADEGTVKGDSSTGMVDTAERKKGFFSRAGSAIGRGFSYIKNKVLGSNEGND